MKINLIEALTTHGWIEKYEYDQESDPHMVFTSQSDTPTRVNKTPQAN